MGSTFDATGMYRMNAVFALFRDLGLTPEKIE